MDISIINQQGKKIFCRLDRPDGDKKSFPAILVVHGFKGDSTQRHITKIAGSLNRAGFAVLRPDLTKNPGNSYLEFSDMTYKQELSDLEDIYSALAQIDGVDFERVGVAGHSLGGMLAAELASKYSNIKSLATLSAVYDFKSIEDRIFSKPHEAAKADFYKKGWTSVWSRSENRELLIRKSFYEDALFRTAGDFANNIHCPVLIISGSDDESVSQSHATNYLKHVESSKKKMEIITGADHNYSGLALDIVSRLVCAHFTEVLLES